ncbi:hypothetical protein MUK42_09181 [Musa troglodytarum]|uniref:Protein HGH1 N-terminal domain-containing protein n=1 Tax=Musa troglodytarum TaxID=320322 RepID=A0A9E7K670_9LILI|nr:hypothetical protein MUK42_09181 [Musa troglodytarum]
MVLQVKKAAVDIVRGLTGSDDGLGPLAARADIALPPLARLIRGAPELAAPAAEALINLSQDPAMAEKLIALGRSRQPWTFFTSTAIPISHASLLCSLPISPRSIPALGPSFRSISNQFILIGDDKIEGLYISKLVRSFCRSSPGDSKAEDTFEHVASVLVNISKVEAGRKILLEPKRGLLKQAICQLDSSNPLKKM